LRRDFYALSGLFYVADKHFENVFANALAVQQDAEDRLETEPAAVDLNLDSLAAFLHSTFPDRKHAPRESVAELADELLRFGHASLSDVERTLSSGREAFEANEAERIEGGAHPFTDVGVVRISLTKIDPKYQAFVRTKGRERREAAKGGTAPKRAANGAKRKASSSPKKQ
jgi:putative GTP pyrophosphokinase